MSDAEVSVHVLVRWIDMECIRELARRTRWTQADLMREAVDDLLAKYGRAPKAPCADGGVP